MGGFCPILFQTDMSFGDDLSVLDEFYFPVGKSHIPNSDALDIFVILFSIRDVAPRKVVENH